ncbi:hypothetical protein [Desulfobulbus alkaliphilus]|uniref:hypothetical protein n=1 Tax=Desulfobulbus alkaliphilus TaxID=869814 RepID=UPI0019662F34|nr:hypothetical protein [Desulfobulbus alkaliphilus]MBM9536165.1 hypothetical protein [Desulfobulbus alkaliphilus]
MEKYLMNPHTGSVQTEPEWGDDYANTDPELWGGPSFEDAELVELATLLVSGHGGRDGGMCQDGTVVSCDGEAFRVVCDHPEGWHITTDPMARRVLAEPIEWDHVDGAADDIRCYMEVAP